MTSNSGQILPCRAGNPEKASGLTVGGLEVWNEFVALNQGWQRESGNPFNEPAPPLPDIPRVGLAV